MLYDDRAYELFAIITHYNKYGNKLHLICYIKYLKDVEWIICNNSLVSTTIEEYFVNKFVGTKF